MGVTISGGNFARLNAVQTFTKTQTIQPDSDAIGLDVKAIAGQIESVQSWSSSVGSGDLMRLSPTADLVVGDLTGGGITAASVSIANSGTDILSITKAAGSSRNAQFPDNDITVVGTTNTQNLSNKSMQVSTVLIASTASSGVSWSDTSDNSKKLRAVLSGAVGNNSLTVATTAARDYKLENCAGSVAIVGNEAAAPSTNNLGSVNRTAITAVTAATNLTSATAVVGQYLVLYEMTTTTGTVADGTLTFDVIATGDGGAQTVSSASLPLSTATLSATNPVRGSVVRYVASGALQYSTTVTGAYTAATTRTALRVRVVFLG